MTGMEQIATKDELSTKPISIYEAADILGVYPGTLRRWVHSGKVPTVDPPIRTRERRRLRFDPQYIRDLVLDQN